MTRYSMMAHKTPTITSAGVMASPRKMRLQYRHLRSQRAVSLVVYAPLRRVCSIPTSPHHPGNVCFPIGIIPMLHSNIAFSHLDSHARSSSFRHLPFLRPVPISRMAVTTLSRPLTRLPLYPKHRRVFAPWATVTMSASGADVGFKGDAHSPSPFRPS